MQFFSRLKTKLIASLILTCDEFAKSYVIRKEQRRPNSIRMKFHILICKACQNYTKQIDFIDQQAIKLGHLTLDHDQLEQIKKSQEEMLKKFGR